MGSLAVARCPRAKPQTDESVPDAKFLQHKTLTPGARGDLSKSARKPTGQDAAIIEFYLTRACVVILHNIRYARTVRRYAK